MSTTATTFDDEKKAQDGASVDVHKTGDVELSEYGFTKDMFEEGESGVDPAYQAKARRLNEALQEIGMGKYQVCVFTISVRVLSRFGILEMVFGASSRSRIERESAGSLQPECDRP